MAATVPYDGPPPRATSGPSSVQEASAARSSTSSCPPARWSRAQERSSLRARGLGVVADMPAQHTSPGRRFPPEDERSVVETRN
jgi:hypothetical protein